MFLSYREFLESLRVPRGTRGLVARLCRLVRPDAPGFRDIDAHQAFEEMRGVIAAEAGGCLTREAYRALGVRQSIFAESERGTAYTICSSAIGSWLVRGGPI